MALIGVHDFAFPPDLSQPLVQSDVLALGSRQLQLDLALAIQVNARAIDYRGRLLMRMVQRELSLVLTFYPGAHPRGRLQRHPAFASASSHIRRFTTEVVGLGVLHAVVTDLNGRAQINHFDTLPAHLKMLYPATGTRPDLRFSRSASVLAGEARGRDQRRPTRVAFSQSELQRLNQLLTWRSLTHEPVCMTWSWLQDSDTQVNHFFEHTRGPGYSGWSDNVDETGIRQWLQEGLTDEVRQSLRARERQPATARDSRVAEAIAREYEARESQLVESTPRIPVPGLDGEWFGEWLDVPTYDGEPGPRLLMATTPARRRRRREAVRYRSRAANLAAQFGIELASEGRLLTAIDWESRPAQESGPLVAELLEADSEANEDTGL